MSASVDKATRRDLRRAMGAEAIAVLNSHADTLHDLLKGLERFNARLSSLQADVGQLHQQQDDAALALTARCEPLARPTFWSRLRWLMRGR